MFWCFFVWRNGKITNLNGIRKSMVEWLSYTCRPRISGFPISSYITSASFLISTLHLQKKDPLIKRGNIMEILWINWSRISHKGRYYIFLYNFPVLTESTSWRRWQRRCYVVTGRWSGHRPRFSRARVRLTFATSPLICKRASWSLALGLTTAFRYDRLHFPHLNKVWHKRTRRQTWLRRGLISM